MLTEWVDAARWRRAIRPSAPFSIAALEKAGRLAFVPRLARSTARLHRPCIALASHPSLRHGDAAELVRQWRGQPQSLLLLPREGTQAEIEALLAPFCPLAMRVCRVGIEPQLTAAQVRGVLQAIAPKQLVLPYHDPAAAAAGAADPYLPFAPAAEKTPPAEKNAEKKRRDRQPSPPREPSGPEPTEEEMRKAEEEEVIINGPSVFWPERSVGCSSDGTDAAHQPWAASRLAPCQTLRFGSQRDFERVLLPADAADPLFDRLQTIGDGIQAVRFTGRVELQKKGDQPAQMVLLPEGYTPPPPKGYYDNEPPPESVIEQIKRESDARDSTRTSGGASASGVAGANEAAPVSCAAGSSGGAGASDGAGASSSGRAVPDPKFFGQPQAEVLQAALLRRGIRSAVRQVAAEDEEAHGEGAATFVDLIHPTIGRLDARVEMRPGASVVVASDEETVKVLREAMLEQLVQL